MVHQIFTRNLLLDVEEAEWCSRLYAARVTAWAALHGREDVELSSAVDLLAKRCSRMLTLMPYLGGEPRTEEQERAEALAAYRREFAGHQTEPVQDPP